ncbi:MBL fold metallo-hydrolase [Culicoidibacter larvae]|uniref:MBL fold metallo-hydrolase n=1 Tax=Culicoidibacter larvae TaxID=2579976 RepID=A0A5R8QHD9_9FIRM|nr:MBL fold metallo-hydrolase [Culicoidibacter larvae]TLG77461.1 MBL fold metallo-hydrolase [Culicoidibacter larvae]
MQFAVLFSGSSGNSSYVRVGDDVYLIDAGVSTKRLLAALAEHNIDAQQIKAVFLTHEHSDHIAGLRVLCDKYNIPLYTNEQTFNHIPVKSRPVSSQVIFMEHNFLYLDQLYIKTVPISHDAKDGLGYVFETNNKKVVYLTDTGYVSEAVKHEIAGADGYIIESNHDPELLLQSAYPWHVRQRILSDQGHLSNESCGYLLANIISTSTRFVVLAHLSENNNLAELALKTVENILVEKQVRNGLEQLCVAYQDRRTAIFTV